MQPTPSLVGDQLQAVAAAAGDAIITADADGRITGWLGAAEAILGWTAEEAVGQSLTMVIPEELRAAHRDGFARVVAGGRPRLLGRGPIDLEALRNDGLRVPVELTLGRGEHDGAAFFVGVLRDVTARRAAHVRLSTAQEGFRSAFEHAPIGMMMTAPEDGRYLRVNTAFCELLGFERDVVMLLRYVDVTHPDDRAREAEVRARLLAGEQESARFEKRFVRRDGSFVWTEVAISLVRDAEGAPQHFLAQALDVDEQRRMRLELERSNRELEDFAAVASHDLREPLQVAAGFLDLLRRRKAQLLDDEARVFLDHAADQVARMQALCAALLRLAKAGDDPRRDAVDLSAVAREAVGAVAAAAKAREVRIEVGELPVVRGDADLLRQVLQNLVGNAVRFAEPPSPAVLVSAHGEDRRWVISVADNGPGVPAAERDRVFERFARGPAGDGGTGAGLGLAICRHAIERLGGRIWIGEAPGRGADVRFSLPRD